MRKVTPAQTQARPTGCGLNTDGQPAKQTVPRCVVCGCWSFRGSILIIYCLQQMGCLSSENVFMIILNRKSLIFIILFLLFLFHFGGSLLPFFEFEKGKKKKKNQEMHKCIHETLYYTLTLLNGQYKHHYSRCFSPHNVSVLLI